MPEYPVINPALTWMAVEAIVEQYHSGNKPKAFETMFRYSDSGSCGARIVYSALGEKVTNPMDPAGEWVTSLGTMIHEAMQARLLEVIPDARVEIGTRHRDLTSGSCDAYIPDVSVLDPHQSGTAVFELKTKGGFAFDKAVGLKRKQYRVESPDGPPMSVCGQGALNAVANDADWLIIGYVAMEAVSKGLAEKAMLRDRDRIVAEWWFPQSVFRPWAEQELARLADLADYVNAGALGPMVAIDDDGAQVSLNPHASRRPWQCDYCPYLDRCIYDRG